MDNHNYINHLVASLKANSNPDNAAPMKKYMKNHFDFLGIKSPERKLLLSEFLKNHGLPDPKDLTTVIKKLWAQPQREFQYCAMTIADKRIKHVDSDFLSTIEFMITNKPWWDTVDLVAARISGKFFNLYPEHIPRVTDAWSNSENIWLNRSAILYQLGYKEKTNLNLLAKYIISHSGSKEFFIQKAIGWALREYSKKDPDWVKEFIGKNELASLSVREGLKWINRK